MIKTMKLLAGGFSVALLAACAAKEPRPLPEIDRALKEGEAQHAQAPAAPPPDVSAALMPPINIQLPGVSGAETEPRFDVRVRRVPAKEFFLGLVEGTPYNIVVPDELQGIITLELKNMTVPEVMEVVRSTYGFEYERNKSGFTLLPERPLTRIFHVDYLDVRRTGQSQMSAHPGEVSQSVASGGTSTATDSTGATGTSESSYSRIATESKTEFWTSLAESLRQIVTGEGRSVTVNSQAGVVVVRAMPAELRAVNEFLNATQATVQRQVILEARIMEVELADGFQAGINWSAIRRQGEDSLLAGQFGGSTVFDTGRSNLLGQTNALDPTDLPAVRSDVASAFGGMFALALDVDNFTAFIELLKSQGEVQVLSSPRVSTVNNQKAVIRVGSDEFFVTGVDSSTTTGASTNQQVNVELTPFFSGVALDVIPQIGREGDIILHVHPSVSEVSEQVKNIAAGGDTFTLPLAASTIRESDSVVRARDGQIVVIGGLMQTRNQDDTSAVPLLSDIPLLGNLFKHKRTQKRKSELVILLKPTIVGSGEVWVDQIKRSSQTMRALGEER